MAAGLELMWVGMTAVFCFLGVLVASLTVLAHMVPEEREPEAVGELHSGDLKDRQRRAIAAAVAWKMKEGA